MNHLFKANNKQYVYIKNYFNKTRILIKRNFNKIGDIKLNHVAKRSFFKTVINASHTREITFEKLRWVQNCRHVRTHERVLSEFNATVLAFYGSFYYTTLLMPPEIQSKLHTEIISRRKLSIFKFINILSCPNTLVFKTSLLEFEN